MAQKKKKSNARGNGDIRSNRPVEPPDPRDLSPEVDDQRDPENTPDAPGPRTRSRTRMNALQRTRSTSSQPDEGERKTLSRQEPESASTTGDPRSRGVTAETEQVSEDTTPYQGTNEVDFDEMYADPEEERYITAGTTRHQRDQAESEDEEEGQGSPLTEMEEEGESQDHPVSTIPEDDEGNSHRDRVRNVDILQDVLNGVWDTLRTQHDEMVEMRTTQAAELERQCTRHREDERRYQSFTQNLIEAQRKLITFASTRGYEVPGVDDFQLSSAPSDKSNEPMEGSVKPDVQDSPSDSNVESSKRSQAQGSSREPSSKDSTPQPERQAPKPDRRREKEAPRNTAMGKDEATRLREAGLLATSSASRFRQDHTRYAQPEQRHQRRQERRPDVGQERRRQVAVPPGGPPDDDGSSSDEGRGSGSDHYGGRGGRRRRDTDEESESRDSTNNSIVYRAGPQSAPPRGINRRYIVPVSQGNDRRMRNEGRGSNAYARRPNRENDDEIVAYENNTREWIREVVRQDLDHDPEDLPVLNRNVRLNMPTPYSGEDDVEFYGDWVQDVTRFCHLTRVVGRGLDGQRVILLGDMLKGEALKWYKSEVRSPERLQRHWTFLEVIYALQDRFVHQATAQQASQRFDDVRFSSSTGVAGLANELLKFAARMVERPDNYSLRKKFQKELPNAIVVPLLRNQKVNAENSTFHRMVKEALEIENANKALEYHQRKQELTSSRTTKASQPTTTTRQVSFARNTTVTPTVGSARRSSPPPRRSSTSMGTAGTSAGPTVVSRPASSASRAGQRVQSETRSPSSRNDPDHSHITCYGCGGIGHVKTSPLCPLNVNQNLRRMESEDATRGEEHADTNVPEYETRGSEDEQPLEGEQFDYDYPTEVFDEYLDSEEDTALRSIQVDVDEEVNDPEESVSESSEPSPQLYGMSVTNESDHKERLAAIAESTGQRVAMRVTIPE